VTAVGGDWSAAWSEALDALELDVEEAEALLRANAVTELPAPTPWARPQMGPLPDALRPRAAALLDRQLAVADAITRTIVGNHQQQALLGRIESGDDGGGRPAYVDRSC
jgi:hypothetical protein